MFRYTPSTFRGRPPDIGRGGSPVDSNFSMLRHPISPLPRLTLTSLPPPSSPGQICGLYQNDAGGKIIALGSVAMLTDQYLEKEENSKIKDVLFDMLCSGDQVTLNRIDASNPEVS